MHKNVKNSAVVIENSDNDETRLDRYCNWMQS